MWPPRLPAGQRAAYVAAMAAESTKTRVETELLTLDHKLVQSLDYDLEDGQRNFQRGTDVDMSLQAGFVDLDGDLLDLDLRYLIRVTHHLWVPSLDKWVATPQFTGQVVAVSSDGDVTTIEAHGKEAMALLPGAPRRSWKAGRRVAGAIRSMFEDLGETKFRIPEALGAELRHDMVSGGRDEAKAPMRVARRMANAAGYQVFYDELGFLVVRRRPKQPVAFWSEDIDARGKFDMGAGLLSPIRFSRDLRGVRNRVVANGKKKLQVRATAPRRHVFSAQSLERGGVPGWRTEWLDAEQVGNRRELVKAADDLLDRLLVDRTTAQFETVPAYHVGPWDRVRAVKRNGRHGEFWLSEASVPLGSGVMTVGYQQRVRKQTAGRMRL